MRASLIHLQALNGAVHQQEARSIAYVEDSERKVVWFDPAHEVWFDKPGEYTITGVAREEGDLDGRTSRPAILKVTATGYSNTTSCDISFPEALED